MNLVSRLSHPSPIDAKKPASQKSPDPPFSLTREQALSLFAQLDELDSTIANAQAVEVSIQDLMAEDVLFAAVEHFGDRMSCLDPEYYRAPNDLWINIDFTDRGWDRHNIWENARARLEKPDGRLVLVTQVDRAVPEAAGLELIEDGHLELGQERFGFSSGASYSGLSLSRDSSWILRSPATLSQALSREKSTFAESSSATNIVPSEPRRILHRGFSHCLGREMRPDFRFGSSGHV